MPHNPVRIERPRSFARSILGPLALALTGVMACGSLFGCASQGTRSDAGDTFVPIASPEPDPIGKLLADFDLHIRAWTNLTLTANSEDDRARARQVRGVIARDALLRIDDLIAQLQVGPARNRQRAAAALGFTGDARAQGPLLAALDDPDSEVASNALLGLALLGRGDTPTGRIEQWLVAGPDPMARNNAAFALRSIVEAGAEATPLARSARMALDDQEPGVRVSAALIVGLAGDAESIPRLGDLARSEPALVRSAAAEALRQIGQRNLPAKGACARALFTAWSQAPSGARPSLRSAMGYLAGADLGSDEDAWKSWAHRLP